MGEVTRDYSVESKTVSFDFGDGTSQVLKLEDYPQEMVLQLALHGLSAKAGDSFAGAKAAIEKGYGGSKADYCKERVSSIHDQLLAGEWNAKREGSSGPRVSQLAQAVAVAFGVALDVAVAKLSSMGKDEKAKVQANKKVAKALADIRLQELEARRSKLAEDASKLDGSDSNDAASLFA